MGQTDLPQLIALLGRARLVVSADSGPMHLAAARERPVVALFGPADPERTGPWGEGHVVLRAPEHAMNQISVAEVERAIRELLSN